MRPWLVAGGWLLVAAIVWLSLTPAPPKVELAFGDKLGHFVGYGTLMAWFCQLYRSQRARLAYGAGFIAMGVGLEVAQGTLGYRSYEEFDMLANALGVLIGWAISLATPKILPDR